MQKLKDLAVKTGEYVKDGKTKNRYENIGGLFEKDGNQFILMKRTFNPAGVNSERDTILISMFDTQEHGKASADKKAGDQAEAANPINTDEIPF